MPERRIPVFFYGLFMDQAALRAQGFDPINPRPAELRDMALRIGQRATLVPQAAASTHGIVMDMTHADIERLYSGQTVAAYRPEPVLALLADGTAMPALCFNLPTPPAADERNVLYAAQLRETCRRLGLPARYVEIIG